MAMVPVALGHQLAHRALFKLLQALGHVVELLRQRAELVGCPHTGFASHVALPHRLEVLGDLVNGAEQLVGVDAGGGIGDDDGDEKGAKEKGGRVADHLAGLLLAGEEGGFVRDAQRVDVLTHLRGRGDQPLLVIAGPPGRRKARGIRETARRNCRMRQ